MAIVSFVVLFAIVHPDWFRQWICCAGCRVRFLYKVTSPLNPWSLMVSGILILRFEILYRPASRVAATMVHDRWIVTRTREFNVRNFVQKTENDTNAQFRIRIATKQFVQKTNKDNVAHAQLTFLHGTSILSLPRTGGMEGDWNINLNSKEKRNLGFLVVFVYLYR